MTVARGVLPLVLVALAGVAACTGTPRKGPLTPEELKERAGRYEARYKLIPGDARYAAAQYPGLDGDVARGIFERFEKRLGMKALALDDALALEQLSQLDEERRARIVDAATTDAAVAAVERLRGAVGYDFRIREVELLPAVTGDVALLEAGSSPSFARAVKVLAERRPGARLPLLALVSARELGQTTPGELDAALDRFALLEVDLGVRELDPRVLEILAYTARRPAALEALTLLRRRLRELDVAAVTSSGLDTIAGVGSTALDEALSQTAGTRFGRRGAIVDKPWASTFATLAAQPGAPALLALLDAELPELRFEDEADARAVAEIAAAGSAGRGATALSTAFRSGVLVDSLDAPSARFLVALVAEPPVLEAVKALHKGWPRWHATPPQLPAIRAVVGAPGLGKLLVTLGSRLGYEPAPVLSLDTAKALAQLAADDATPLADALHLVFPRLKIQDLVALHELHELVAEGVAPADVLRLDLDTVSGNLGPRIRSAIAAKARSKRAG